jgi:regulation of enolase protein 1 (concanavalin A-like superfamily)
VSSPDPAERAETEIFGRRWTWTRDPISWALTGETLTWRCPGDTDYWRTTEGLQPVHNGCSLLTRVEADFELELLVSGEFADRYDQAGLMVLAAEERWLKAGIEVDGEYWLSAVHTRDESDWSRERWNGSHARFRAVRTKGTIDVSTDESGRWRIFRTLFLPGPVAVGPYSCAPKGGGFEARASELRLAG